MKRDYESVERRRSQILKMIREQDTVKVEDLAEIFQMSSMSVRRDLQYLEDRNLITRFYGGAKANAAFQCKTAEEELILYRKLLGRYAATKVAPGDTIFINMNHGCGIHNIGTIPITLAIMLFNITYLGILPYIKCMNSIMS